jgi:hypothetical protein
MTGMYLLEITAISTTRSHGHAFLLLGKDYKVVARVSLVS